SVANRYGDPFDIGGLQGGGGGEIEHRVGWPVGAGTGRIFFYAKSGFGNFSLPSYLRGGVSGGRALRRKPAHKTPRGLAGGGGGRAAPTLAPNAPSGRRETVLSSCRNWP